MGHSSWIVKAKRIKAAQRAEASAELIRADAVGLVGKWNPDIERHTACRLVA